MGVNSFDVLKRMSDEGQDIRMSDEVLHLQVVKKRGTRVTIGIDGNVLAPIFEQKMRAVLLCFDVAQFKATKKRLEEEAG